MPSQAALASLPSEDIILLAHIGQCLTILLLACVQSPLKVPLSAALWSGYHFHAFSLQKQRELSQGNADLSCP